MPILVCIVKVGCLVFAFTNCNLVLLLLHQRFVLKFVPYRHISHLFSWMFRNCFPHTLRKYFPVSLSLWAMFFLHKLIWNERRQHVQSCCVSTQTAQLQNDDREEINSFVSWRYRLAFPSNVYVGRIYRSHCCESSPSEFEQRSLIGRRAFSKNA